MPITRSELSPGQQGTVRAEGPREGMEGGGGERREGKMDREPGLPNLPPR